MCIHNSSYMYAIHMCNRYFFSYDPTEDSWTEVAPMASGRVLAGSVVHHGCIYVIGRNSVWLIITIIDTLTF